MRASKKAVKRAEKTRRPVKSRKSLRSPEEAVREFHREPTLEE